MAPYGRRNTKQFMMLASLFAFTGVVAGAFGAHILRGRIEVTLIDAFETGVRYHLYHALALYIVGWISSWSDSPRARYAGWSFISGIALFSGSLYCLAITGERWLGAITPIGGLAFLVGWGLLFSLAAGMRTNNDSGGSAL